MVKLGGFETYVATPASPRDGKQSRGIVLFADIFGLGIKNPKVRWRKKAVEQGGREEGRKDRRADSRHPFLRGRLSSFLSSPASADHLRQACSSTRSDGLLPRLLRGTFSHLSRPHGSLKADRLRFFLSLQKGSTRSRIRPRPFPQRHSYGNLPMEGFFDLHEDQGCSGCCPQPSHRLVDRQGSRREDGEGREGSLLS